MILPRPDPAGVDPAEVSPAENEVYARYFDALFRPAARTAILVGYVALLIGMPLFIGWLYATGSIEVDRGAVLAMLVVWEVAGIANLLWFRWRGRRR